jgi:hypothetical protein
MLILGIDFETTGVEPKADGSDERGARWSGCTHMTCECGTVYEKGQTKCRDCYSLERSIKYDAFPMEQYDGEPVCAWDDDKYFFDEDALLDYMWEARDAARKEGCEPLVEIVKCKPHRLGFISEDWWADDLPEDGELDDTVAAKLAELNEAIRNAPTSCWMPDNIRIDLAPLWAKLDAELAVEAKLISEATDGA